jgi:hypothetical protein
MPREAGPEMKGLKAAILVACFALTWPATLTVSAAAAVTVRHGTSYGARIFPDNAFTTSDPQQLTGLRVNFRQGIDYPSVGGVVQPACTSADYSI